MKLKPQVEAAALCNGNGSVHVQELDEMFESLTIAIAKIIINW